MWASVAMTAVVAATPISEEAASRPISDAVVRGLWSQCPGVKVERNNVGVFTVKGPDRVVGVVGTDTCTVDRRKDVTHFDIEVDVEVTDLVTHEGLAGVERGFSIDDVDSCDEARKRALAASIAAPNTRICTEGFHPTEPEPMDLAVMLQPTLSPVGPVSVAADATDAVNWKVNGHDLRVVGTSVCKPTTRVIEGRILGAVMRSWTFATRVDIKEPALKSKLQSLSVNTTVLGISCAKALEGGRKKVDADLKKAVDGAMKVLPKAP